MNLSNFILENVEEIIQESEYFAVRHIPEAKNMDKAQLRDHLDGIVQTIAANLACPQRTQDQIEKLRGQSLPVISTNTAATIHAASRRSSGFSLKSTMAEYRALRARVIRLWERKKLSQLTSVTDFEDLIRFNEAIDQAISQATTSYSTEREHDKLMFETILESCSDLISSFDLEGRFLFANKALTELIGLPLDKLVGKNHFDLDVSIAEELKGLIEQAIHTKQAIRGEVPYTSGSGTEEWYEYLFTPVVDYEGHVEAVACIGRNVTQRKQTEIALNEADRQKNEFLAMLAHELRNPLMPISNIGQTLNAMPLREGTMATVSKILNRNVNHIIHLVDDLMDVSRINQGLLKLKKERVELVKLLRDTIESIQVLIQSKQQTLIVDLPAQPIYIDGDPVRLAQVFSNLLTNAAKYSQEGARIDLITKIGKESVVVRVQDNGMVLNHSYLSISSSSIRKGNKALLGQVA
jgi:PAS domain S-box-containing protein